MYTWAQYRLKKIILNSILTRTQASCTSVCAWNGGRWHGASALLQFSKHCFGPSFGALCPWNNGRLGSGPLP